MAKTRDFPPVLRHFVKVMNKFRGHYYDYDIFQDFIDYITGCLLIHGHPETADRLKAKYGEDYPQFAEMFAALVQTMNDQLIEPSSWYDALGTLYEEISSRSKSSALGQFFTPAEVCDLTAGVQGADDKPKGKTVNDPSAGSGRMLLSWHVKAPGNYLVAQDLDPICTKMAAINMALHGCRGQSLNGNTLTVTYNFGYEVNPWLCMMQGIPHLVPITQGQARSNFDRWKALYGNAGKRPVNDDIPEPMPEQIIIGNNNQLMLF